MNRRNAQHRITMLPESAGMAQIADRINLRLAAGSAGLAGEGREFGLDLRDAGTVI
jgi:hypothetical protein